MMQAVYFQDFMVEWLATVERDKRRDYIFLQNLAARHGCRKNGNSGGGGWRRRGTVAKLTLERSESSMLTAVFWRGV